MNKKILFSICLIVLTVIIGIGCASAADNTTASITDMDHRTVDQNTEPAGINEVINEVKEINTGHAVSEVNRTNSKNITEKENPINENNQNSIVNDNDTTIINKTEPKQNSTITGDDEEDNIVPGNGYSIEEIKEINGYVKYYKEHNYDMCELFKVLIRKALNNNMSNLEIFSKYVTVIHNQAMLERGYGTFYNPIDLMKKYYKEYVTAGIAVMSK